MAEIRNEKSAQDICFDFAIEINIYESLTFSLTLI